jgi:hypothetical protein
MAKDIGGALQVTIGSNLPTYKAVLFDVVPYTSATDILNIAVPATATVAVVLTHSLVSYEATAASTTDAYLVRRVTANSGGTPTTFTTTQTAFLSGFGVITQSDTADPASQSVVVGYTAAPTLGTPNIVEAAHITVPAAATPTVPVTLFEVSANRGSKPTIVRPGQSLSLSLGGNAVPAGANIYASVEWIEVPLVSLF